MMRFSGRVFRVGRHWAVEVPILGITTQGRTKRDALDMVRDAVETLVNHPQFSVRVRPGEGTMFQLTSDDHARLTALLLRRARQRSGLTLAEVAKRLGAKSANAYARYEQGRACPTVGRLAALLSAVLPESDFVLEECARESPDGARRGRAKNLTWHRR